MILEFDTGKVYGMRYYTVKPVWEPPSVYSLNGWHNKAWNDMMTWCVETYGPSTSSIWSENSIPEPGERWYANNSKFWFRREQDRDWFVLRWS